MMLIYCIHAGPDLINLGPSAQFFFGALESKKIEIRKILHREGGRKLIVKKIFY